MPMLAQSRVLPAPFTAPVVHVTTTISAWLMWPASSSSGVTTPSFVAWCSELSPYSEPSPSSGMVPPPLAVIVCALRSIDWTP